MISQRTVGFYCFILKIDDFTLLLKKILVHYHVMVKQRNCLSVEKKYLGRFASRIEQGLWIEPFGRDYQPWGGRNDRPFFF